MSGTKTDNLSVKEWIIRATARFENADAAWSASLKEAFGAAMRERRYDWDQSQHPDECKRLCAERELAQADFHAAWNAQYEFWRRERLS